MISRRFLVSVVEAAPECLLCDQTEIRFTFNIPNETIKDASVGIGADDFLRQSMREAAVDAVNSALDTALQPKFDPRKEVRRQGIGE